MANGIFEVDGFVPEEIEVIDKDGVSYLLESLEDGNGLEIWKTEAIPNGYRMLEYIESNGNQYIDTGIQVTDEIGFEVCQCFVESKFGNFEAFGGGENWSNGVGLCTHGSGTVGMIKGSTEIFQTSDVYTPHVFKYINGQGGYLDDEYKGTSNSLMTPSNATMCIFKHSTGRMQSIRVYYCKIYRNNDLIFDGYPCISPELKIGLFDNVTKQFFTTSTTYGFLCGPSHSFQIDSGYYIDSGIIGDSDTSFEFCFLPQTETGGSYIGDVSNDDNNDYRFFKSGNIYLDRGRSRDAIGDASGIILPLNKFSCVRVSNDECLINGIKIFGESGVTFDTKLTMKIGERKYNATTKWVYIKIYKNGKLVYCLEANENDEPLNKRTNRIEPIIKY